MTYASRELGESPATGDGESAPVDPAVCVCGHPLTVHKHYRRGRDCGVCGATKCARFRAQHGPFHRLRSLFRKG